MDKVQHQFSEFAHDEHDSLAEMTVDLTHLAWTGVCKDSEATQIPDMWSASRNWFYIDDEMVGSYVRVKQ